MNTLVLGRRGLGKTTLAVWRGKQLSNHLIAWSPGAQFGQWSDLRTTDVDKLIDYVDEAEDDEPYLFEYIPDGDLDDDFELVGRMLWQYGDYVLIVDEANEIQSSASINPVLSRYIRRAPRREKGEANPIDIIQTSHFPVDLHRVSIGLSDEAYIFRLTRERDQIKVHSEFGEPVAIAVNNTKTPETNPSGRDVVKVNLVTQQFEVITDSDSWNVKRKDKDNGLMLVG